MIIEIDFANGFEAMVFGVIIAIPAASVTFAWYCREQGAGVEVTGGGMGWAMLTADWDMNQNFSPLAEYDFC